MYTKDPFQFSAAGYRLAGMMIENQMRAMLVFTDAAFGGSNPFLFPPVVRHTKAQDAPRATSKPKKPQIASVTKARVKPLMATDKTKRRPPPPHTKPHSGAPIHPAE